MAGAALLGSVRVARAQSFAYSVVAYNADHWDVIDAPKDVEKLGQAHSAPNFRLDAGIQCC